MQHVVKHIPRNLLRHMFRKHGPPYTWMVFEKHFPLQSRLPRDSPGIPVFGFPPFPTEINLASPYSHQELEDAIIACAGVAIALVAMRRGRKRRRRSVWARDILLQRGKQGACHKLVMELGDSEGFQSFRVDRGTFNDTLASPLKGLHLHLVLASPFHFLSRVSQAPPNSL